MTSPRPINLELFSCAGGMAEGFRRAGVTFDLAIDFAADHCDSYETNLGHRPVQMDVRDLLRMVRLGWRVEIDLLVADPPCTPWSRAGKRKGIADERDMLVDTCELIALLRPRRYLIGNVPGLDDSTNWHVVLRHIGGLAQHGYCVADFATLDAADFGVPQHRVRPFWFGHMEGSCIRWPAATHCDPDAHDLATIPMFGAPLLPWVTCRQALGHLRGEELGRRVKMKSRDGKSSVHTSEADRPGAQTLILEPTSKHPAATPDAPAPTIRSGGDGHSGPHLLLTQESGRKRKRPPSTKGSQSTRVMDADAPATVVQARTDRVGNGSPMIGWPWDRPSTTVHADPRLAPPGYHAGSNAVLLSERAAAILQGFPEDWVFSGDTKTARWSQLGQAMPIALAEAVARAVVEQDRRGR